MRTFLSTKKLRRLVPCRRGIHCLSAICLLLMHKPTAQTIKKAPLSGAVFPMAGVAGLEPTHAGFRDPCLTNLAIPLCLRRLPLTVAIIHERMMFGKPFFENFSKKLSAAHQYAPLLSITALNVLKRYMRSIQMLQLRTYHVSISTRSSYVVSLLPLACHMPVMPGRTI